MRLLCRIGAVDIWLDGVAVRFVADADIDCDGGPNPHHDPCWQPETSLRFRGKSIDAETVPYVVVPPQVARMVRGVVLGCHAVARNTLTGAMCDAVVADIGPTRKTGEISPACARLIGVDPHPIKGGEHRPVISYTIVPGVAAKVGDVVYDLQPLGKKIG